MTPYNIAYLQELVRNGPTTYPGARYVVRDTGERIDLRYNKRADAFLQYGWIVERHLKDGEYVVTYDSLLSQASDIRLAATFSSTDSLRCTR